MFTKNFYILIALILSLPYVAAAQLPFIIRGKLNGIDGEGKIAIRFRDGDNFVVDTVHTKNGQFELKGTIIQPEEAAMSFTPLLKAGNGSKEGYAAQTLFLEPGVIEINGNDLGSAIIKAGKNQDLFVKYKKGQLQGKEGALYDLAFIERHGDEYLSMEIFRKLTGGGITRLTDMSPKEQYSKLLKAYQSLSPRIKSSYYGEEMGTLLKKTASIAAGKLGADFSQPDTSGRIIKLSDFRGKFVLVDFWASWCIPCRAEIPKLRKIYEKYKGDNFEIVSTSLDGDRKAWLKASREEKLEWINLSDLRRAKNSAAEAYGVTFIPQNVLVGPDGMIIEKNLKAAELDSLLSKLTGSKKPEAKATELIGKLPSGTAATKIYASYYNNGKTVLDTALIENGIYHFSFPLAEVGIIYLQLPYKAEYKTVSDEVWKAVVFTRQGENTIVHGEKFADISNGSNFQDEFNVLRNSFAKQAGLLDSLKINFRVLIGVKGSKEQREKNAERYLALKPSLYSFYKNYIVSHPGSAVGVYALARYIDLSVEDHYNLKLDEVEPLYSLLDSKVKNIGAAKEIEEKIAVIKPSSVGQKAPQFSQKDQEGRNISLNAFKGKYLLLDFWASWCGPCRKENPKLVKLYGQFKEKGFEILGIACEKADARSAWLDAIRDDKLNWTQVCDFKYNKNEAAVLYNIKAIPQNVLIDPNGKIIGRNLNAELLEKELNSLLGKKG